MLVSTWDHRLRRNSALRLTVILSLAGSHTLPSISGRDGEIHQALLHFREGRAPLSRGVLALLACPPPLFGAASVARSMTEESPPLCTR